MSGSALPANGTSVRCLRQPDAHSICQQWCQQALPAPHTPRRCKESIRPARIPIAVARAQEDPGVHDRGHHPRRRSCRRLHPAPSCPRNMKLFRCRQPVVADPRSRESLLPLRKRRRVNTRPHKQPRSLIRHARPLCATITKSACAHSGPLMAQLRQQRPSVLPPIAQRPMRPSHSSAATRSFMPPSRRAGRPWPPTPSSQRPD